VQDVVEVKEKLAQSLFDHIPVGVGSQGIIPTTTDGLEAALEMGMDWYGQCHTPHILAPAPLATTAPGVIDSRRIAACDPKLPWMHFPQVSARGVRVG
jgi:hypothetical protein